jgi:hypothetical protein
MLLPRWNPNLFVISSNVILFLLLLKGRRKREEEREDFEFFYSWKAFGFQNVIQGRREG